jgi:RNA-directed DNA polymerase
MKRHGNLYPKICEMENIRAAHDAARRGKSHYREVKMVNADPDAYLGQIHNMLANKTFRNAPYVVFRKTDQRKARVIHKLPYFPDRIVHHCIVQVLEPIWMAGFIHDTLACIKGRGIHAGVKKIKKALHEDPEGTRYCLKMDVRQFYPTMDHEVLMGILERRIKDPEVMWLLDEIIGSTPSPGLPIGNYLSQYFGNVYLSNLDHCIKEDMRCRHYWRYCDDMVILDGDKAHLHDLRQQIAHALTDIKLEMKDDWQVFPVPVRGLDFMGYRFFPGYTLLRKTTAQQFKRVMTRIKKHWRHMRPITVVSTVMSYHGWMKHANCLHLWCRYVDEQIRRIVAQVCAEAGIHNPMNRRFA